MQTLPEAPSRVRLTPLSKLAAAPKWQLETMRALREPLFLWVTSGQGRINFGGTIRGFHPHNAIFVPAGTMYSFQALTRVQGTAIYFGVTQGLGLPDTVVHLRLREATQHAEVSYLVDCVQREADGKRPHAERAMHLHLALLALWIERHVAERTDHSTPATPVLNANERLTARYAALMERQFGSSLNVTDYAAALGVTPTHLTRACRASCARTALELLQERRLYEARVLLLETDMPVQDIALGLGFTTPGYFSRAFSQHIGQPPSSYRKSGGAQIGGR